MPRVANQSRNHLGSKGSGTSHSPLKIPLNDDRHEKAIRFQSRQALHDIQINQIKAAASPARKVSHGSPQTPGAQRSRGKENLDDDGMLSVIPNNSMTPMKRVPILANFEEWMKMATDNKINATNSWNFALIDYFHDMSLLKEGDGVNFQKASCTLDGCVKIYTSRVDSVATETGKLLSGLADSSNKKQKRDEDGNNEESDDGGDDEEGEGVRKQTRKKAQRSSEATLASNFAQLQLKKFELEFAVDPLFKKASADFDEGGAKGLLLNHLAIDEQGRIVFDSSDDGSSQLLSDTKDGVEVPQGSVSTESLDDMAPNRTAGLDVVADVEFDISLLANKYFPDLTSLDEQDICPSMNNFDLGDPNTSLDLTLPKDDGNTKGTESKDDFATTEDLNGVGAADEDDDSNGFDMGLDMPQDTEFGDGGEVWARHAALEPTLRVNHDSFADVRDEPESDHIDRFDLGGDRNGVSLAYGRHLDNHNDILGYFDRATTKNWAGPEHWRIKRIKDSSKQDSLSPRRKEKDPFEIDFVSPLDPAASDSIYTAASSNSIISLPKTQWRSQTRNLLPDDKHFNSKQLIRLFLKPRARLGAIHSKKQASLDRPSQTSENDMDGAFWARQNAEDTGELCGDMPSQSNYDANFFQDDCLAFPDGLPDDEDDFADARETFSPSVEGTGELPLGLDARLNISEDDQRNTFGSQLVTQSKRVRPEYVQYARVAKKVDVRRLKEEMWRGIGFDELPRTGSSSSSTNAGKPEAQTELQFTSVMNGLREVYPKQAMVDISTSYCFICLLHLANEKGLKLDSQENLEELVISQDAII